MDTGDVVTVRTIPVDPTLKWLDCNRCGPLGLALTDDAHCTAMHHLAEHGIEVAPC